MRYAFALTGGIATGKSTVSKVLKNSGFDVIDLDEITHKILDLHVKNIEEIFGKNYIKNQMVDRAKLGKLVFDDKEAKKKLENFIHPLIRKQVYEIACKLDDIKKPYFVDIPLFFENQKAYDIKNSILVYAPKSIQLQRLMKRSNLNAQEAMKRISAQMNIEKKKELADFILDNSGKLKELLPQIEKLKQWIKEKNASIKI